MDLKNITKKAPFKRISPNIFSANKINALTDNNTLIDAKLPSQRYIIIPQEQFLEELSPTGHIINLKEDKIVKDVNGEIKEYLEVAKRTVALQKIIATKQKIHLATNQLKFTLTEKRTPEKENLFTNLKQAWIDKNMHVAISEYVESLLETGDTAIYFYREKGKVKWITFSFKKGDVLLPHYDDYGNLILFARMYAGFDEKGKEITKLEVFDKSTVTKYVKKSFIFIKEKWKQISKIEHGFSEIPICYTRNDDVCWGDVQSSIDGLEEAISNMAENNRYYANLILFLKGDIEDLPGRNDAGKVLTGTGDAEAKFLATPESSKSQMAEIDFLLKQIFIGSFTVSISPDTVKSSGDLPGITVKLLFSPAIEKALDTSLKLDASIDKMLYLFKEAYGIEIGNPLGYSNLKVRGAIDIYVPQNNHEIVNIINESIFAKSLSKQTGQEKHPLAVNDENKRVNEETEQDETGSLIIDNPLKNKKNEQD